MDAKGGPSIFEFSAKFCNKLDNTKNWAFSPTAVAEISMAAMYLGSHGTTDASDSKVIQIPNGNNIPSSYLSLAPKLKSTKGITIYQANKIYLTKNLYKLSLKQKKVVNKIFNVNAENINFCDSYGSAKCINEWVKKKTKNNINQFLTCNHLYVDTDLVLISGIYFKGVWQMKFDPEDTEEAIFYLNGDEIINVFLMYRKERYRFKDSKELDAQLVLIPFKTEEAHALVVLPKRVTGLNKVLERLADGYDLMAEVDQMSDEELIVRIPRFKIECEINFTEVLHKVRIKLNVL
ncbi:antichymotrypsin-2-like [Epargyreus clarus]|uniref:antichymotrypsin-2-like n=1 Tax=Epargyreus clarus TaxID=520877 RepID=UPI003C2C20C2